MMKPTFLAALLVVADPALAMATEGTVKSWNKTTCSGWIHNDEEGGDYYAPPRAAKRCDLQATQNVVFEPVEGATEPIAKNIDPYPMHR